jgi:predicted site-specific integrase-resolvase
VPRPTARGFAAAAMTGNRMSEDLMTRRQVASLFQMTSAAVATWARRGRLPEVRNEAGRPRYRRADVEALFRSGVRRGAR